MKLTMQVRLRARPKTDGVETIIVTGDMDTLQLIDDRTRVMVCAKVFQIPCCTMPTRYAQYGLGPEQMIDFKASKGSFR